MNEGQEMNILQVNNSDIIGKIFNGHDLQITLNKMGHISNQAVNYKYGTEKTTIEIGKSTREYIDRYVGNLERELSMNSLLGEWDRYLDISEQFLAADIVHYHKIHAGIMSILNFPRLIAKKPSVWTIHDPWAITGHCVHPLDCNKWETGCRECPRLGDYYFPLQQDKASQLWNIKKKAYADLDIDIVVSTGFMEEYIKNSPLTNHLMRIHKIPFGIKLERFNHLNKQEIRRRWKISDDDIVIGFRNDENVIKGCKYIFEALEAITDDRIVIVTIGEGKLPKKIKNKFRFIELNWQNDEEKINEFYSVCDMFLMPSIAESFGIMAIEAMASKCAVIVFKDTVLEDLVFAQECGIAVKYKDSKALAKAISRLLNNPAERKIRGEKGRRIVEENYNYWDYVNKHIELYREVLEKNASKERGKGER